MRFQKYPHKPVRTVQSDFLPTLKARLWAFIWILPTTLSSCLPRLWQPRRCCHNRKPHVRHIYAICNQSASPEYQFLHGDAAIDDELFRMSSSLFSFTFYAPKARRDEKALHQCSLMHSHHTSYLISTSLVGATSSHKYNLIMRKRNVTWVAHCSPAPLGSGPSYYHRWNIEKFVFTDDII